jgi:hypothetical protein
MSEKEEAQITIARLLKHNLRVVKDNEALANINVTGEFQEADALKGYEGQVTVALAECVDQKLELSGKNRKRTSTLRVNVWATDFSHAENARLIRGKLVEEVSRVVRQNRSTPNETLYYFAGSGNGGQTCKAFHGNNDFVPGNSSWTELSSVEYQQLWYSDDRRYQTSNSQNGEYAALLLGFKLESRKRTAKKIVLTFEGYVSSPNGDSITVKVWNSTEATWQNEQTQSGTGQDHIVTLTLAENPADYIDDNGYVWLTAITTQTSNGSIPAVLSCDYASCIVTINGITYCDISSYRQLDRVDVKPFIFRTEFNVKSWFFENIGV